MAGVVVDELGRELRPLDGGACWASEAPMSLFAWVEEARLIRQAQCSRGAGSRRRRPVCAPAAGSLINREEHHSQACRCLCRPGGPSLRKRNSDHVAS